MNADIPSATASITPVTAQAMPPQGISIQCHENDVPPFVEAALRQLYGNLFSSLAFWRVYGGAESASTYVVRDGEAIVTVWLFRREGTRIRVINEGMMVNQEDAVRFSRYIFSRYPSVDVVSFHAIRTRVPQLPLPYQRVNCLEDMVLTLPRSPDDYLASLGKSTRSYIHRYLNKVRRDFPSFHFRWCEAEDIDERHLQQIIRLNRSRMEGKGKVCSNDDAAARRVIQLAMECGVIGIVTIDGRIVAGTINYRIGDNYFLDILAHDPSYNNYRLGTLCCYLTVCACIARGGREYHFLWGMDEYKSHLLGVRCDLDDLAIYRSRLTMLVNGNTVLKNVSVAGKRRARMWLRNGRRNGSVVAKVLTWIVKRVRNALSASTQMH